MRASVRLWLLSAPISLITAAGLVGSLAGALGDPTVVGPAGAAAGLSPGQVLAVNVVALVGTSVVELVFVLVPLLYALRLRRPGWAARRARTVLTVPAALVVAAVAWGYVGIERIPFSRQGLWSQIATVLDLVWVLAVVAATVACFLPTTRRFLAIPTQ